MTGNAIRLRAQVAELTRLFLARFFEADSTVGRTDLRESFFWLVGGLAAPGMFFAVYQQFFWQFAAHGPGSAARLQAQALHDKAVYLTLTMVVIGIVTIATRSALLVDRRDAVILGVLPTRPLAIVLAKVMALATYVGALNLGMHAGAAVLFGGFLGAIHPGIGIAQGAVAHLVAAGLAGTFVFLAIVTLECACLAIGGPRRYSSLSPLVQLVTIVAIAAALFITPAVGRGFWASAAGDDLPAWIAALPPAWFLGLYEFLSSAPDPMTGMATTAARSMASLMALAGLFYVVASLRMLSAAAANDDRGPRRRRRSHDWVVTGLTRAPNRQATLQFLLSTTSRVGRFRLTMAGALTLGVVLTAPVVAWLIANGLPTRPTIGLVAAPSLVSLALVAGWRIVVAMPSELRARWIFLAAPVDGMAARTAVDRLILATAIILPLALVVPVWVAAWGLATAAPLIVNGVLAGMTFVRAHLWGYAAVPCTRALAVTDSNVQGRWPFYLAGIAAFSLGWAAIEVWLWQTSSVWLATPPLAVLAGAIGSRSTAAARLNLLTNDHRGLILLDLTIVNPDRRPSTPSSPQLSGAPHA